MPFKQISRDRHRRQILHKIVSGGFNASSFILLTVGELGKIALESFHPKNYSFTKIGRDILGLNSKESSWRRRTLTDKMGQLIKIGLVVKDEKRKNYYLSSEGQELVNEANDYFLSFNKKWDGIFRVVIFDIPERKKEYRNWLRSTLYSLNFKQLQKSVFIGKNSLPVSLVKEISYFKLDDFIHIFSIREIDNKSEIGKGFKML